MAHKRRRKIRSLRQKRNGEAKEEQRKRKSDQRFPTNGNDNDEVKFGDNNSRKEEEYRM